MHISQNRHKYGTIADTLQLLKACQKGTYMNCWEAIYIYIYMQVLHQHSIVLSSDCRNGPLESLWDLEVETRVENTLRN